jgi:hypothetical protein
MLSNELWADHRNKWPAKKQIRGGVGPVAVAEPHNEIDIACSKIGQLLPGLDDQTDGRMICPKRAKARTHPPRAKIGRYADAYLILLLLEPSGLPLDRVERRARNRSQPRPCRGDLQMLWVPAKQIDTQMGFKRPDLPAHGTGCDAKLARCACEAAVARGRLKEAEGIERREFPSCRT